MVLEEGAFGWCLGNECGALMNGISTFKKETPESFLAASTMLRTQQEGTSYELRRGLSPECELVGTLILDFLISRTVRNKFHLFINYLVCSILLD